MKARITAFVICLITSSAHAVPNGCFITEYGSSCYAGQFLVSDCDQWNMTSYYFGNYVSSMCSYVNATERSLASCEVGYESCVANFNTAIAQRNAYAADKDSCLATAASIEANRQQWIAYAGKRNTLVTKLYKACGSKCRKIK